MLSNKFMYTKEDNEFDSSSDVILSVDGDENAAISFSSDDDTDVSLEQLDTSIRNYLNGYLAISNARAYTIKRNDDQHALKALNTTLEMVNSTLRLKSEDTYVITVECTTYLKYTIALEASDGIIAKIWEGIKTFFKKIWDGITSLFTKSESKNAEDVKKIESSSVEIVNLQKQVEAANLDIGNELPIESSLELTKPLSGFIYDLPNPTVEQLHSNLVKYFKYTVSVEHPMFQYFTILTNIIKSIQSIMENAPKAPPAESGNNNAVTTMTGDAAEEKINEILLKSGMAKFTNLTGLINMNISKLDGDSTIFSNKYYIPLGIHNDTIIIFVIGTKDFTGVDKDRYKPRIETFTIKPDTYKNIKLPIIKTEKDVAIYNDTYIIKRSNIKLVVAKLDEIEKTLETAIDNFGRYATSYDKDSTIPRNFIDFINVVLIGYMSAVKIYAQRLYGNDADTLSKYFDILIEHYKSTLASKTAKEAADKEAADKAAADKEAADKAAADKEAADKAVKETTPEPVASTTQAAAPAQVEAKKGLIGRAWDAVSGGKK